MPTWYTAVPSMHKAILARACDNEDIAKCVQMRFVRSSPASLPPQVLGVASDPNEAAHWQLVSLPVAEENIVALAVRGIPSLQARYLEMLYLLPYKNNPIIFPHPPLQRRTYAFALVICSLRFCLQDYLRLLKPSL